jgi:23S rRNA pseudouridine1911/1915/1917 synthase
VYLRDRLREGARDSGSASGRSKNKDGSANSSGPASMGRAAITRLIDAGSVRVEMRRVAPSYRMRTGDRVLILGPLTTQALPDEEAPLSLACEAPSFVVADKPAGMPTHPLAPGELGTLASALVARFPEMASFGYSAREPGIVHRLDTGTSGLVLAARTPAAFQALCAQLEQGGIDKRYLALCAPPADSPEAASASLTPQVHRAWLVAHGPRVRVELHESAAPGVQAIETEIVRVTPHGQFKLVELRVRRAHRHQVRAHLAALGSPIAADTLYGGRSLPGLDRHFLHASGLGFADPATGEAVYVEAPLPPELLTALEIAAQS